jgi:preprotein translocase subunit SecG
MGIVKIVVTVIYIVVCLALIVLTMMQNKDSRGASDTITGSSTSNFYEKNKTRTKEGMLKKWTIILGIVFMVLCIALGIIYVIPQ